MNVKCTLKTYDNKLDINDDCEVVNVINHGELAKIKYKDIEFIVSILELKSALDRCNLNCFDR